MVLLIGKNVCLYVQCISNEAIISILHVRLLVTTLSPTTLARGFPTTLSNEDEWL